MSVAENPSGAEQAQAGQLTPPNDPLKSQFGGQVSSEAKSQADIDLAVRQTESRLGQKYREEKRTSQVKQDDRELSALKENPDAYDAAKVRQEAKRAEEAATNALAEAQDAEQRANDALANARQIESTAKANELAQKNNIDLTQLLNLSDGKIDKMEALATILPKVNPATPDTTTTINPVGVTTLNPDTNESVGGGSLSLETLVQKDTRGMNPTELAEHRKALAAQSKGLAMR